MDIPGGLLTDFQERELEKVNAFYLQKEAEVCRDTTPKREGLVSVTITTA
jgi:hypothetical protein